MATAMDTALAELSKEVVASRKERTELKSVVEGLVQAAKTPASAAGSTPQAWLAKMTQDGNHLSLDPSGNYAPFRIDPRHAKTIGKVNRRIEGKISEVMMDFGSFMKDFTEYHNQKISQSAKLVLQDRLSKHYGVTYTSDGRSTGEYIKTALAESSGITGGYTVPPEFSEQILMLALEDDFITEKAFRYPMTRRTTMFPRLNQTSAPPTAGTALLGGLVGQWEGEATAIPEYEPNFKMTELCAWQYCFYAVASNTILADNAVNLDTFLTQLFKLTINWGVVRAYLQGNGVGQPMGLINAPATIQVLRNNLNCITWADVCNMQTKIYWPLNKESLVWAAHPSCSTQLLRLKDDSGKNIFIPNSEGAQAEIPGMKQAKHHGSLLGRDVYLTEKLPALGSTGDFNLFDVSKYITAPRMELEIDVSSHVLFLNSQLAWRCIYRGDGQPMLDSYITYADGVTTCSPFVTLSSSAT